jgi:hypothetical protein
VRLLGVRVAAFEPREEGSAATAHGAAAAQLALPL